MAKIVVLGSGIAGHTTAAYMRKWLNKSHEVVVISPNEYYQFVPSNIWVGVGRMTPEQIRFKLEPKYKKWGINFKRAKALTIHPEGGSEADKPYVTIEYVGQGKEGQKEVVDYDYLVNATGPQLRFDKTEGLGPEHNHTVSVCNFNHASHAWSELQKSIKKMEAGENQNIVIGIGHPGATCQGAAFEYILNVFHEIDRRGLSDRANITYITNEYEVGDFAMGGAYIKRNGYITPTKIFAESFLAEREINWVKRAGVKKVDDENIHYENLKGEFKTLPYDFAMLIPAFSGPGFKAFDKDGADITDKLFKPNGFMIVDADYTKKPYEEWSAEDWPETVQHPEYKNIFAPGIAFAPPHTISKPFTSPNGTTIVPAPPRTGMPSGVMGKVVAQNIRDVVKGKRKLDNLKHKASMSKMGAACIVSAGFGMTNGMAATMTVFPIVQDWKKYPEFGRSLTYTVGEPGLAGHWLKWFMHYMFLHKAKGYPFWWLLPE